jgi:hypothetical protein
MIDEFHDAKSFLRFELQLVKWLTIGLAVLCLMVAAALLLPAADTPRSTTAPSCPGRADATGVCCGSAVAAGGRKGRASCEVTIPAGN